MSSTSCSSLVACTSCTARSLFNQLHGWKTKLLILFDYLFPQDRDVLGEAFPCWSMLESDQISLIQGYMYEDHFTAFEKIRDLVEGYLGENICIRYPVLAWTESHNPDTLSGAGQTHFIQEYYAGPPFQFVFNYEQGCNAFFLSAPRCDVSKAERRPKEISIPVPYLQKLLKMAQLRQQWKECSEEVQQHQPAAIRFHESRWKESQWNSHLEHKRHQEQREERMEEKESTWTDELDADQEESDNEEEDRCEQEEDNEEEEEDGNELGESHPKQTTKAKQEQEESDDMYAELLGDRSFQQKQHDEVDDFIEVMDGEQIGDVGFEELD